MGRKIKLLWDFRGEEAKETAKHHTIHLKEFAALEKLGFYEINISEINPMLSAAFIIVDESNMKIFRDALKPHRGEMAE
jgi:Holliday junction resolvasome RuvABC DNA-binding subunit